MSETMQERYIQSLQNIGEWVTVAEWAERVGQDYPDVLAKAEVEAENQKNDTTGLREIAARISSRISRGRFADFIEIDTSEKPRKVRYLAEEEQARHDAEEVEEDVAPLKRTEIIKRDEGALSPQERYRVDEFETIAKQLKVYFGLDFEVDHAKALLNPSDPGPHHPNNLQLLLKAHNGKKNSGNWSRFTLSEQIDYLQAAIKLQTLVAPRMNIEVESSIIESLFGRLRAIYSTDG
jgi:hypothetical protein